MFNTYNSSPRHITVRKTVEHKHPPSTEQARYLDELRQQAKEDVLAGVLRETPFGRIHVRLLRMEMHCAEEYQVSFMLVLTGNGDLADEATPVWLRYATSGCFMAWPHAALKTNTRSQVGVFAYDLLGRPQ